jgi:Icc-related predicted phosphoesterase
MRITVISDTHNKHKQITQDLPGGDILIHAGDISSMGYEHEIREFCKWYNSIKNYTHKIFIAGNHDWGFQNDPTKIKEILELYPSIKYLQDDFIVIGEDTESTIKIYGSPWQPRFMNWAFNADRGEDIQQYWDKIPNDTDILITHGPAFGYLDTVIGQGIPLGCENLTDKIAEVKPKIHVCGHIHSGYGHKVSTDGGVHFFNAAVLGEQYSYMHKPITFDWEKETNIITFI